MLNCFRPVTTAILAAVILTAGGCSAPAVETATVLVIPPDRYHEAFDAALDAAREAGMPATLRDRRQGVILTDTDIAPSLLEPWALGGEDQATENTVARQRRWARFEFLEVGSSGVHVPDEGGARAAGELAPPDVVGDEPLPDLTSATGPIELRVNVVLERSSSPGQRRNTWTRRRTTQARVYSSGFDPQPLPRSFWRPVRRDSAAESRLLARVREAIEAGDDPDAG